MERLRLADDEVVGASLVSPAFSSDLSTWTLVIDRRGRLRQEVSYSTSDNHYRGELLRLTGRVSDADLVGMLATAERIGFRDFQRQYSHETVCITDLATLAIAVRFGHEVKTVEAYGPHSIAAAEGNVAMIGFVELWERIHKHAPYGGEPASGGCSFTVSWAARKPWWKFW